MVLLVELLLAAGILLAVFRWATRPDGRMSVVEPDRPPVERVDGPLTADELAALHIPLGVGYRKIDVDRLLDRVARQLPRATYASPGTPDAGDTSVTPPAPPPVTPAAPSPPDGGLVRLEKERDRG